MNEVVARLLDRLAIDDLTSRYNELLDAMRIPELLELWTDDAEFRVEDGDEPVVVRGRDALSAFCLENGSDSVHLTMNAIAEIDGDVATQRCRIILGTRSAGREPGSSSWVTSAYYEDRLVRTADGWRFATRTFRADASLRMLPGEVG
jgi:hypothetical protein